MAVKKPASAKKAVAKSKTATKTKGKRTTARKSTAPATKKTQKPVAKKSTTKAASKKKTSTAKGKNTKTVAKPKSNRGGLNRELNEDTGFVLGTDQDKIALALLEGGDSRADIVAALEKQIGTTTRNDTPKQITNMMSGVLNRMLDRGYTVESSFRVIEPTAASKRAATRKRKK